MARQRTLAMLDSLITAGDEGLSYDGIVSAPERGLEVFDNRPGLAGRLGDKVASSPLRLRNKLPWRDRDHGEAESRPWEEFNCGREESLDSEIGWDDEDNTSSEDPTISWNSPASQDSDIKQESREPGGDQAVRHQNGFDDSVRLPRKRMQQVPDVSGESSSGKTREQGPEPKIEEKSHRCPGCQSVFENPRNLVVFIDGTSHKFGPEKSNVRKLSRQIEMDGKGIEQRKLYLEGIGAYEDDHLSLPFRVGNKIKGGFEMAFASNVMENVKKAYEWLAENYRRGDQIYLFGFSRGAYQVRSLASLIHEVGLVREKRETERAYRAFLSIYRYHQRTLGMARSFKKEFCWPGVKIHFLGVWDTVSSVGVIKGNAHITASASVTKACHFRHALALDEYRVKFMPEYFLEVNIHSSKKSLKPTESHVKEVWFAGSHADVGGTHVDAYPEDDDRESYPIHAGNVSLLWMRQEAVTQGLVFKPEALLWDPEDIDLGRKDSMTRGWKFLENLPVRQQVSFCGTGKHAWRRHRFCPRLVLPSQQIHCSVLSASNYIPRATLGGGVDIPVVPRKPSGKLWATELLEDEAMTMSLTSLLGEQQMTLGSLKKVLFHLGARLDNKQTRSIAIPQLLEEKTIRTRSGIHMVVLAVIYDVTSNFKLSRELLRDARMTLCGILSSNESYPREMHVLLRFLTRHRTLQHFIVHEQMVPALMHVLEWASKSRIENLFPLIMDGLFYLIEDDDLRGNVIKELSPESGKMRISSILDVKEASSLVASLEMIASLARHRAERAKRDPTSRPDSSTDAFKRITEILKGRIIKLAKTESGPVGLAAVGALDALNELPSRRIIPLSNILGYLGNTLARLDAEVDSDVELDNPSPPTNLDLPTVLQVNGSNELDGELMRMLVQAIESPDPHLRTPATLTLLKLCHNAVIQGFCKQNRTLHIFAKQLERKKTSLLAAYALQKCLELGMWAPIDLLCVPRLFVDMFEKGWFDDIVGRVEGFNIFRGLMKNGELRERVIELGIVPALVEKLETGDRHETRMSMICLDIFKEEGLTRLVNDTLFNAVAKILAGFYKNKTVHMKDVKILRILAQTEAGELAIKRHAIRLLDIMSSILDARSANGSTRRVSESQLDDAAKVLYALFSNDGLREHIRNEKEYDRLKSSFAAQR